MNTKHFISPTLRVLSIVLLAACCALDGYAADPPVVLALDPTPNDHQVLPTSSVYITYDQVMDLEPVDGTTFAVFGMESGLFFGSYSADDDGTLGLTPDSPFHAGELVQASATTGLLSEAGVAPLEPVVWQFRTRAEGGSTLLKDTGQRLGEMNARSVALGDLDGDHDLDAFVASFGPSYVWINTGGAVFVDSGESFGIDLNNDDAALGDLDSDGDLDILTVGAASIHGRVWFNDGYAHFTASDQEIGGDDGRGAALGDLDGDADLDIVYVYYESSPMVLFNDGNGVFVDSGQNLGVQSSMDVALGDLNGDGFLDAYIANAQLEDRVYLNDGTGTLIEKEQTLSSSPCNTAALGDLDNDGDLDVFLGIAKPLGSLVGPDEVWFNDGSGTFTDSGQRIGTATTTQANLVDLDGDGDLDAFSANTFFPGQVWVNDGSGVFSLTLQFFTAFNNPFFELGDLDNDGDIDAFLTDFDKPGSVWLNQNYVVWTFAPLILK